MAACEDAERGTTRIGTRDSSFMLVSDCTEVIFGIPGKYHPLHGTRRVTSGHSLHSYWLMIEPEAQAKTT